MTERVAIVGSRDYPDPAEVVSYVLSLPAGTVIVSGGARGVDLEAETAARARGLDVVSYRPVKRHGKWVILRATWLAGVEHPTVGELPGIFPTFSAAAYFRNGLIVVDADRVEAFWDGKSPGTSNSIELARKAGKFGDVHGALWRQSVFDE